MGLYLLHVAYLSLGKFDYGYNMAACVTAGLPSTITSCIVMPTLLPHQAYCMLLSGQCGVSRCVCMRAHVCMPVSATPVLGMEQKTVCVEMFGCCGVWQLYCTIGATGLPACAVDCRCTCPMAP